MTHRKIAGYVRVSTEKQKEEKAHERQKERLEKWAENREQNIDLEIYEDAGISGQSSDREAYNELMEESTLEEIDAVVIRELSRLGRDLQTLLDDSQVLKEHDVDLISLRESMDTSSAEGQLIFNVLGAINQFKSDLARERTEEMIQRRKEQGKQVGRPQKLDQDEREELVELREENELGWTSLGRYFDISRKTAKRTYERETEGSE